MDEAFVHKDLVERIMTVARPKRQEIGEGNTAVKKQKAIVRISNVRRELIDMINEVTYNKHEPLINEIAEILWDLVCVPFGDGTKVNRWRQSAWANLSIRNEAVQAAVEKCEGRFEEINIMDWFEHLRDPNVSPQFNINANYMSIEKSKRIIKEWLVFQFGDEWVIVLDKIYRVSISKKFLLYC